MKDAINNIKDKNITIAKENYKAMQSLYPALPDDFKKANYKKMISIQFEIDKREISGLLNECLNAIKQGRKQDARLIYEKIKPIYHRLPQRFKKGIYEKIIPYIS